MAMHWYRVLGPRTTKRSCVQTQWCAGETPATETLAMSLTWGCRWLVRLGVLFLPSTYTRVIFSFREVGESKFIRVQWKRLCPCAVPVSLLSVRSRVNCLITVFWMFANQTFGEYSNIVELRSYVQWTALSESYPSTRHKQQALCREPMVDQMIKLVTGKNQFHDCHLWVNVQKLELLKSSGLGEDPLKNYGISQSGYSTS
jgi:hypothetical protein